MRAAVGRLHEGRDASQCAAVERVVAMGARALVVEPRMLLLDEPMAGTGPESSRDVARLLESLKGRITILLVEHDMDLVFAVADTISVMVSGRCIASGPPDAVRADPHVRRAYLGEDG